MNEHTSSVRSRYSFAGCVRSANAGADRSWRRIGGGGREQAQKQSTGEGARDVDYRPDDARRAALPSEATHSIAQP